MAVLPTPKNGFKIEIPVVIAGAGACGLTAALAARDEGAEVLVLEKDSNPQGTTSMSQGEMCAAGTRMQKEIGIDDSPDLFFEDVMTRTEGKTDPELVDLVSRESGRAVEWLADQHGFPFEIDTDWRGFGHSRQRLHCLPARNGQDLMGRLVQAAEAARADLLTNAQVTNIYADADKSVTGVKVNRPDGSTEDIGCGALVLATCGFANNREMISKYIPEMAEARNFTWENSLGDGIKWGMELGGAVADMSAFQGYGALAEPNQLLCNYNPIIDGGVMVNSLGERFSDEMKDVSGQGVIVMNQPGGVAFMVYDENLHNRYKHLHETRQAIDVGAVHTAHTLGDFCDIFKLPVHAMNKTLDTVRRIKSGKDRDPLGRDFVDTDQLEPPYVGIRVTGALFHTQGGLVVNENAQVKREDGTLLPNLFAGGGTARGITGPTCSGYIPAAGICMAITLGRLAGRGAAKLVQS